MEKRIIHLPKSEYTESEYSEREYLFVYGTLRRELRHPMNRVIMRHADYIGTALLPNAQLYRIQYYPGCVPSDNVRDVVLGEVYAVYERELWSLLDTYEGADGTPEAAYVRRQEWVILSALEQGDSSKHYPSSLRAFIYFYNRSTQGLARIWSGDFLATDIL